MTKTFLLVLLALPFTDVKDKTTCRDLHEGEFTLAGEDNTVYKIIRTKTKQTEISDERGIITELDIKWTSDCTFLLYNPKVIKRAGEPIDFAIDTLYNEITEVEGNRHVVVSSMKGEDFKAVAVLIKNK